MKFEDILRCFWQGINTAKAAGVDALEVYDNALSWVYADLGVGREWLDDALNGYFSIVGFPEVW